MNSTTFYIDCLCLLPLDFLYLSLGFKSILRIFRLVKVYRFWAFMDRSERHTNYPNLLRFTSLIHYLLLAFHWNACLFHLLHSSGGFGSEVRTPARAAPDGGTGTNRPQLPTSSSSSLSSGQAYLLHLPQHHLQASAWSSSRYPVQDDSVMTYLMSYHWTVLAMTTIGDLPQPRTKSEYLYVIFQLIFGLITFATVLGYIANIVTNVSAARKDFQGKHL